MTCDALSLHEQGETIGCSLQLALKLPATILLQNVFSCNILMSQVTCHSLRISWFHDRQHPVHNRMDVTRTPSSNHVVRLGSKDQQLILVSGPTKALMCRAPVQDATAPPEEAASESEAAGRQRWRQQQAMALAAAKSSSADVTSSGSPDGSLQSQSGHQHEPPDARSSHQGESQVAYAPFQHWQATSSHTCCLTEQRIPTTDAMH